MADNEVEVFLTPDGSLYHLGVKSGEINPRIITVGDRDRASIIAQEFLQDVKEYEKTRNFRTFSGTYKGVPVSIVSIGMGAPNMDFLVEFFMV
ncbi:uridine phosphorylase, putative [Eimeria maxima]|uniref:Uridine phosphorylase, putative n=1 Tax=Eimeria maxima TaxID=5804 RepID=U6M2Z7_EIMMA|nr:uridine phosphorylase, putative [Eimeria maxima]CDJ58577.1 uridine phosphorylase, putative [Eimeria maxima]